MQQAAGLGLAAVHGLTMREDVDAQNRGAG